MCTVKKTPDNGQRNCSKHVEFHSKNKYEKLVHLVGFYYTNFSTMHGHMNVKSFLNVCNICRFLHDCYVELCPLPDVQTYCIQGEPCGAPYASYVSHISSGQVLDA